ncbi:MAG: ABC transporter permease [Defluviitaleaceae bacterium]|nr:ABC transporter permease [Defluviitaleaceae bacterium]
MRVFQDSWTMFKRCLTATLRNPEAFGAAIIAPAMVMFLFGTIFGNVMDVGYVNYIDFIVPGIILQTVAQGTISTAISVNNDLHKGIIDRFRSMPIAKSAVLNGHVLASVMRNILTTAVVIGVAIAIGFRPQAGILDWLVIAGVFILFMFALTWISVIAGLAAKAPENTTGMLFLLFILPFLSSGFVPTESLPNWMRGFAEHQPMTPIIDATRSLFLGHPPGNSLPIAIIWSTGIIIVATIFSIQIYKRKLS